VIDSLPARLAALEARVYHIERSIETINKSIGGMDGKLDQLIDLRSKGMGVFWVLSLLFGSGMVASIVSAIHWIRM
jgi:hypothetical protein